MKNQDISPAHTQRGSIFTIILIAVFLFGALSYAMSRSMSGGTAALTQDKAKIIASEIMDYSQKLRNAVHQLRINGCTDTQITFEGTTYTPTTDYTNSLAPTSKKCHVFAPEGGGLNLITPVDKSAIPDAFSLFTGSQCYDQIGMTSGCAADAKELEYNVINIPKSVCVEINKLAGINMPSGEPGNADYYASITTRQWQGAYFAPVHSITGISAAGKNFGCYRDNSGSYLNYYIFYQILISR